MPENRDFAWLRKTLCDEIEAVRNGTSDHNRAKSVTGLAVAALKSVEVEAMLRQQEKDYSDKGALPLLGATALCAPSEESEPLPELPSTGEPLQNEGEHLNEDVPEEQELAEEIEEAPDSSEESEGFDITQINSFKVGDRVMCPNGKRGTIKSMKTSGRIDVKEDEGGTLPYIAKHLEALTKPREPVTSPIVSGNARFVAGSAASGGR